MEVFSFQNGCSNNRVETVHGVGNRGLKANMSDRLNQSNTRAGRNRNNSTTTYDGSDEDINRVSSVSVMILAP